MTYKFGKELKVEEQTWYSINATNIMFSLLVIVYRDLDIWIGLLNFNEVDAGHHAA